MEHCKIVMNDSEFAYESIKIIQPLIILLKHVLKIALFVFKD